VRLRFAAFASLLAFSHAAPALAQRAPIGTGAGRLEAARSEAPLRLEPAATYGAPPAPRRAAWERFLRAAGAASRPHAWQALWDRDTLAPLRVFGAGIPAPGAIADGAVAEAAAIAFIDAHRDLIAPGTAPDHLRLVANDLDAGLRTVAFSQHAPVDGVGLVPVVGGRVSVRFKNDRLFVFAAEAFPPARLPTPQIDAAAAVVAATAWIAETHAAASLREPPELVALPLVGSGRASLNAAFRVVLDADAPRARWAVYVDARSGAPLAREQLLRFDQATIVFDAPVRAPQLDRTTFPARALDIEVDGAPLDTDDAGAFTWTSTGMSSNVLVGVRGPLVRVNNQGGASATALLPAADGASIAWSLAGDEIGDAQISTFIHAGIIKDHAAAIAPDMEWLGTQLVARPNVIDPLGCNAFWDGTAVNFYRETGNCNNTARLADVVYHEFGHGFHQHSIIAGAGALDASLGEAAGDTMSVSKTHDPRVAPGFYLTGEGVLRHMDDLRRWPDDISFDPHETGVIWGGAMWDLRTYLVADLGETQGHAVADQLYYQALRRSSSIPASYAEILAADDDDGDLSNGTPHVCAINRAFLRHGLSPLLNEAGLVLEHTPLASLPPGQGPYPVHVAAKVLYPQCGGTTELDSIALQFHLLGGGHGTGTLEPDGDGWSGTLPAVPDGTAMRYSITAAVAGNVAHLPDNAADPEYRVFVGETVPIYCNDFETQIDNWSFSDSKGGKGDFEWGIPQGQSGDPALAYSGQKVIGDRLGGGGAYTMNRKVSATSPAIDVGAEKSVRLQFRRWLNVYDGVQDQATIYVDEQPVWQNAATDSNDGTLAHKDAEWRFEDIDLSPFVQPGATTVQVRFELASDLTLQLGGWNVDDFCIVAWHPQPPPSPVDAGAGGQAGDGGTTEEPEPASGCGCAIPGHGDAPLPLAATLALLTAPLARRRPRRTAPPRSTAKGR
jgi:Zn-dependent metalloprotease